jgi:hypothetical protein
MVLLNLLRSVFGTVLEVAQQAPCLSEVSAGAFRG